MSILQFCVNKYFYTYKHCLISIGYWQVLWVLFNIYWLMAGTVGYWGYQESISIRYFALVGTGRYQEYLFLRCWVSLHWQVLQVLFDNFCLLAGTADIKNISNKMLGTGGSESIEHIRKKKAVCL